MLSGAELSNETSPWHSTSPYNALGTHRDARGMEILPQSALRNKDYRPFLVPLPAKINNLLPRNAQAGGTSVGFSCRRFCNVD